MKIHKIETGLFKLDGGAMFGVVPKSLWSRKIKADENNLCTWSMRCLLIETEDRLILIDTGLGDKQSEKFFSYVQPHGDHSLIGSILDAGFSPADITDVILTHLHFDHVGGAVSLVGDNKLEPTFANARYWSHSKHWQWAENPNPREKASFLKENFDPLMANDQVFFIDEQQMEVPEIDFIIADGHTESQIIPIIDYNGQELIYCADLLPSVYHIPTVYVMGYDVRPLVTMQEKQNLLQRAEENQSILLFEHDEQHEACTITSNERGFGVDQIITIDAL